MVSHIALRIFLLKCIAVIPIINSVYFCMNGHELCHSLSHISMGLVWKGQQFRLTVQRSLVFIHLN